MAIPSWVKYVGVVATIGAIVYGSSQALGPGGVKEGIENAISYVEAQGDNAMYFYLFFTFVGVVCLIPTTPMEFAGGFLFSAGYGMWTTWFMTSVAKLIANIISVMIARYLVKDWVLNNIISKFDLMKMVRDAVKEEPYKMAFLVRGSMLPLFAKNYGLGVLDIGYLPIAICSCIFTPFYAFQNIYFGSSCKDLKEVFSPKKKGAEGGSWVDTFKSTAPIMFNVLLVIFLVRAIKGQIKKQKAQIEQQLKEKENNEGKKKS